MLLIVVLVSTLLIIFMKNHKGGVCPLLFRNTDMFIISTGHHIHHINFRSTSRRHGGPGIDASDGGHGH